MESKRKPYKTRYGHKLRRVVLSLDDVTIAELDRRGNGNKSQAVRDMFNPRPVGAPEPQALPGASPPEAAQPGHAPI